MEKLKTLELTPASVPTLLSVWTNQDWICVEHSSGRPLC